MKTHTDNIKGHLPAVNQIEIPPILQRDRSPASKKIDRHTSPVSGRGLSGGAIRQRRHVTDNLGHISGDRVPMDHGQNRCIGAVSPATRGCADNVVDSTRVRIPTGLAEP